MTDKEKILAEIKRMQGEEYICDSWEEEVGYFGALDALEDFINSLPEEPISEDFEEALSTEWEAYNNRGAASVDALEDNTQELAFAKGFYYGAQWQKEQDIKKACEWIKQQQDMLEDCFSDAGDFADLLKEAME